MGFLTLDKDATAPNLQEIETEVVHELTKSRPFPLRLQPLLPNVTTVAAAAAVARCSDMMVANRDTVSHVFWKPVILSLMVSEIDDLHRCYRH